MFHYYRKQNFNVYVKITRDIGISTEGYVEIPPISLPTNASMTLTFSTRESDAILLFAIKKSSKKQRQKRLNDIVSMLFQFKSDNLTITSFEGLTTNEAPPKITLKA